MKVVLEEWRHWLEGAAQLLLVWMDHRNLEYVQTARRLNAQQARWALYLGTLLDVQPQAPTTYYTGPASWVPSVGRWRIEFNRPKIQNPILNTDSCSFCQPLTGPEEL